jgi:hypothetical protein
MTGLGGAEFRLPLLIGFFGFAALQAVITSKALSLIVAHRAPGAACLGFLWRVASALGGADEGHVMSV